MKNIFKIFLIVCILLTFTACDELESFLADMSVAGSRIGSSSGGREKYVAEAVDMEWNPSHNPKYDLSVVYSGSKYWHELAHAYRFKGKGTADNPVLIRNAEELTLMYYIFHSSADDVYLYCDALCPNAADTYYIKLMADIDFAEVDINWIGPLNQYERPFNGVFDGNGKVLKNFNGCSSFMCIVGQNGIIKNLTIQGNIKFNPAVQTVGSPFCRDLEGTIINCRFEGTMDNAEEIYDIAYSKDGMGYAVGCVSYNDGRSTGSYSNTKIYGCATGNDYDEVDYYNQRIGVWNALYSEYPNYKADFHLIENEEGIVSSAKGAPATVTLPNGELPAGFHFNNLFYASDFYENDYATPAELYYMDLTYPIVRYMNYSTYDFEDLRLWGKGTCVVLEPTGTQFGYDGGVRDSYRLLAYVRQDDGSYREYELLKKDAVVYDYYENGKKKAITIRMGSYSLGVATKEFLADQHFFETKDSQWYYICTDGVIADPKKKSSYPSLDKYNKLISSGNW